MGDRIDEDQTLDEIGDRYGQKRRVGRALSAMAAGFATRRYGRQTQSKPQDRPPGLTPLAPVS